MTSCTTKSSRTLPKLVVPGMVLQCMVTVLGLEEICESSHPFPVLQSHLRTPYSIIFLRVFQNRAVSFSQAFGIRRRFPAPNYGWIKAHRSLIIAFNRYIYTELTLLVIRLSPGTARANQGRWLSASQITRLIAEIKRYIADNPSDNRRNVRIDEYFRKGWRNRPKRRYCPNANIRAKFVVWTDTIEKKFCKGLDPTKTYTPFMRCPMEAGWALHVDARLQAHRENGSTTHIYGLINTLTSMLFNFPPPEQFVIFPVWETKNMPQVAEITASILCSSYWYNGGLNHFPAGAFADKFIDPEHEHLWQKSAEKANRMYQLNGDLDLAENVARSGSASKAAQVDEKKNTYESMKAEERTLLNEFIELRQDRAQRRLQEAEELRKNLDPALQPLEYLIAKAGKQAEVKDWVRHRIRAPTAISVRPENHEIADLADER